MTHNIHTSDMDTHVTEIKRLSEGLGKHLRATVELLEQRRDAYTSPHPSQVSDLTTAEAAIADAASRLAELREDVRIALDDVSESYAHDPDCGYTYRNDGTGEYRCIGSDEIEQERDE